MTSEDVLDRYTATPRDSVEWVPEWDENPDAQPGENTRIEDDILLWERDGFEVMLESYETTHWRALVTIPERVGELHPRPFDLKCNPLPEHGFIKSVEQDSYVTTEAELILQANFQPVFEVNKFIDSLLESHDEAREFQEELEAGLDVAQENEEEIKAEREPGAHPDGGLVCPHCKEIVEHVHRADDGVYCPSCDEPVDDYVVDEDEME